jgi:hypothetical protein
MAIPHEQKSRHVTFSTQRFGPMHWKKWSIMTSMFFEQTYVSGEVFTITDLHLPSLTPLLQLHIWSPVHKFYIYCVAVNGTNINKTYIYCTIYRKEFSTRRRTKKSMLYKHPLDASDSKKWEKAQDLRKHVNSVEWQNKYRATGSNEENNDIGQVKR